ncbi:MAG: 1-acyl-sn-glycerol-3-phosphate acyltransferase [Aurantimonas endophytica]|uniref:lysophospholipid acyltransferase family protein n=1 Tax=Aurantimonas endophytica TaxID=1522175 RepID=UPI0030030E24
MIAWLRVGFVALVLTTMTLVLWPLQNLAMARGWNLARRLPHFWHVVACAVTGLKVTVVGRPSPDHPLLIASNHQSWADIMVLGRIMPLSFIAKAEVRDWPAFGLLARLQRTVFVERGDRRRTGVQADAIAERLNQGDVMVLFAEGTTSDGNEVLPFKTALFGAAQAALRNAETHAVRVQPVSIAYTSAHGVPLGRFFRPLAAWPGDVPLGPHLLAFLREGAVEAEVTFGEPLLFDAASDRKQVARTAEERVRHMLVASLRGHSRTTNRDARRRETDLRLAPGRDGGDIGI